MATRGDKKKGLAKSIAGASHTTSASGSPPIGSAPATYEWSNLEDTGAALALVQERHPQEFPHGMLVQDPPSTFSWGWYWFASPEERMQFVLCLEPRFEDMEMSAAELATFQAAVTAKLSRAGVGPAGRKVLAGLGFNGGTIDWVGTFEHLTHGKDACAKKCRADFWERQGDEDEEGEEGGTRDPKAPIPDELIDEFMFSLSPE